jgi:hypothetical protein
MDDLKLRVLKEMTSADHLRQLVGIPLLLCRLKKLELLLPILVLLQLALGVQREARGKTESVILPTSNSVIHEDQEVILLDFLGSQCRLTLVFNNPRFDDASGIEVGLLQLVDACKGHYKINKYVKIQGVYLHVNLLRIKNHINPYELFPFPAHTMA